MMRCTPTVCFAACFASLAVAAVDAYDAEDAPVLRSNKGGNILRVGGLLDFVRRSGATRTEGPHGGALYARRAERNRIVPHRGEIERLGVRTLSSARSFSLGLKDSGTMNP